MDTTPVMAKPQINRPVFAAALVLAGLAAVQIVAASIIFASKARDVVAKNRADSQSTAGIAAAKVATAVPGTSMPTLRAYPNAQLNSERLLPPPQTNPTPVPEARLKSTNKVLVSEQIELAISLRERGDIPAALNKLKEADSMAPNQPQILAEMALTYEKFTQNDRAIALWQRVKEMGESAGLFYEMADQKLKHGVGPHIPKATFVAPPKAQQTNRGLFGVEEEVVPGLDLLQAEAPEQVPPTAKPVNLADVSVLEDVPGDALTRMQLRATVQASPRSIERQKLQIEVLFYDLLDKEFITQTAAEVTHQWITVPVDWEEDGIEVLQVDYKLMKPKTLPGEPPEDRKYFGYVVRLYYDNELQDVRAQPARILNDYPAPQTLSPENPPE